MMNPQLYDMAATLGYGLFEEGKHLVNVTANIMRYITLTAASRA
jgi:hypothetical protein